MGSDKVQAERDEDMAQDDLSLYLQELAIYHSNYELQPGEFTINDVLSWAKDDMIDRGRVTADLHRRAKAGELGEKKLRLDGSQQWIFWQIKNPAG